MSSSQLTILHGLTGQPLDTQQDLYALEGIDRGIVKAWFVATIGANKPISRWPKDVASDYRQTHGRELRRVASVKQVEAAVIRRYPLMADWGKTDGLTKGLTWADLMFAESEAIIRAMKELMSRGIASLSVHDSLIVGQEHKQSAKDLVIGSYRLVCGIEPKVKG